MLHEFALEPEVLSNWKDFRFLVGNFGVSQGRLISRFPKHWKRLVYEACVHCLPLEKKKIEDGLIAIDKKLFACSREYDGNLLSWLENAEAQHQLKPFRAIIAKSNPRNHRGILVSDDLEEDTPLWKVGRECRVDRKADVMASCCSKLLQKSKRILFVDQHFRLNKREYLRTLEKFISIALEERDSIPTFEYHLNSEVAHFPRSLNTLRQDCEHILSPLLPKDIQLTFVVWAERGGGEKFHPRYILTDKGGIRVEAGLDEGDDGSTTDMSLLDEEIYQQRWKDYQKDTSPFEYVDETKIVGSRGNL